MLRTVFLLVHIQVVSARLGSSDTKSVGGEAEPISPGLLQVINYILEHEVKSVLNEEIPKRIRQGGMDPVDTIMDEPILHLYNLTGLSSVMVTSIAAESITTDGTMYDARLAFESQMGPISATGYAGLKPHHIPVTLQIQGAKISANDMKIAVSDADLMLTVCQLQDLSLTLGEIVFTSQVPKVAEMLTFVAPAYQQSFLSWASASVKQRAQQEITRMLPLSLLNWSAQAKRDGGGVDKAKSDANTDITTTVPAMRESEELAQQTAQDGTTTATTSVMPAMKESERFAQQQSQGPVTTNLPATDSETIAETWQTPDGSREGDSEHVMLP